MPTFYNFRENGLDYSFDDVFIPADLFRQGNLWTWGENDIAQLGTNNTITRSTPVTTFAGGTNWKQVSGGRDFTAAIKTDGTLWTWANNSSSQLGINATGNRSTPVTTFAGGTNWKQVSAGVDHTAAIKTDGTLWTWGVNDSLGAGSGGQLGTNDTIIRSTPVTTFAGGTNWKQVDAGYNTTAAVKTDGTLWVWGSQNSYGASRENLGINATGNRLTPVTTFAGGTNWKQVSIGQDYIVATKTDGTLWTWGRNSNGQLGTNDTEGRSTPVTTFAGGTNWKQVSPRNRSFTTVAIKTDGTLWVWGQGGVRLGTNDTIDRLTPVTTFAGGTNWKQVSSGRNSTSAIKTDGTLWTWGFNSSGQLGINSSLVGISTPVTTFAGGTNWKQVDGGYSHAIAVTYEDPVI